ncbi:MAG: ABC transporter permease [Microcella sp.]|uniref:ABC transporter permease n=1 Tax=Microcella sp. TaxID=1913979 RepID=UPI0033154026
MNSNQSAAARKKPAPTGVALAQVDLTWARRLMLSPALALSVVIVVFVLFGATQTPMFLNGQTWINILRDAAFLAMAASFATIVLVSGGLDLSVGSVLVAGAMTAAAIADAGFSPFTAFLAGTLVGATVGFINGMLINQFLIPPIIVTLGALFAVRAVVVASTGASPIGPLPDEFDVLGQASFMGIPLPIIVAIVVVGIAHFLLNSTNYGWSVRAIGGNREAARSAGIAVKQLSVSVYVLSGASAAFTGALIASRLGSGSPTLGQGFELQVIAAAIIGGTSISGSIGTVVGAALGALLLSVLSNGLVLLRFDPTLQNFIIGLVLVAAAGLDIFRRQQMFRISARRAASSVRTG